MKNGIKWIAVAWLIVAVEAVAVAKGYEARAGLAVSIVCAIGITLVEFRRPRW